VVVVLAKRRAYGREKSSFIRNNKILASLKNLARIKLGPNKY
jgi:hypothetical protein